MTIITTTFIPTIDPKVQLGILAHEFKPGRARSLAFATFAAGAPLGGVLGTSIGGVLTQYTAYVELIKPWFTL